MWEEVRCEVTWLVLEQVDWPTVEHMDSSKLVVHSLHQGLHFCFTYYPLL